MPETMTAPAPVAAPSTPAPAPTPKAAPSPAKTNRPEIVAPVESSDPFKDAFAELDEVAGKEAVKADKRPKVEKPSKPVDEPVKDAGDPKPEAKSRDDEPKTNPELRAAYSTLKEKFAKEYEPQLKELPALRAKLKEIESRDESGSKAIQDEIVAVKKRNEELEQHMRFVDYEKSTDYRDQFQKPYEDAWGNALRELRGLTLVVENKETGEETRREVTQADIAYFANLDPAARRTEINRLFPEDKEEVKRHINQISNLAEKAQAAREKAKTDAQTHAKTQTEAQYQSQLQRTKLWKSTNEELATKYPKWFGKDPADPEGNTVFDKGSAFADLVFSPGDLTPERVELLPNVFKEAIRSTKQFSPESMVKLHAIARNKLANHDRAITRLKTAEARIAELETSLKAFEDSGPDAVRAGKAVNGEAADASWESELEALDRKGK